MSILSIFPARIERWSAFVALTLGLLLAGPTATAQQSGINLVAAASVDLDAGEVTLPLERGRMASGEAVWFVVLDTSDRAQARRRLINWSRKLANAVDDARPATIAADGAWVFASGTVDFGPARRVEAGPAGRPFPPAQARPGSIADEEYTPLVRLAGGTDVYNAPVLAFDVAETALNRFCGGSVDHALVHDNVTRICPREGTVTLRLTSGFARGKRIEYVSTEANVALVAALEGATLAPRLSDIPADLDDAPESAVEPIYVVINGVTGEPEPARQGLASALADGLPPLNITGDIPTLGDGYSPLWASHPVLWAEDSLDRRHRITSEEMVRMLAAAGKVHGPGGAAIGSDGILVNCPVIARRD